MNEIAINKVERAVQQAIEPPAPGPKPASQADISRFQDAMKTSHYPQIQEVSSQTMQAVIQAEQAVKTPGSSILDTLDRISADHKAMQESFLAAADEGEMGRMVNLQMDVARITIAQTLLGKVGEKAGQGINQLVRGQ